MHKNESEKLEKTLSQPDLHLLWESTYYADRNVHLYDMVFKKLLYFLRKKKIDLILDAGCGNSIHSLKFAANGYRVKGIDFSEEALKLGRANIISHNLQSKIELQKEDILSLSFEDNLFDVVFCWGVLMHISEIEKALSELARVLKKDGIMILAEGNMKSLQTRFAKSWKKKHSNDIINLKDNGLCFWSETSAGEILVRKTNIKWLIDFMQKRGLKLVKRFPGHFTSFYTRIKNRLLKNCLYFFNDFWFKVVRNSSLAETNILIFSKK